MRRRSRPPPSVNAETIVVSGRTSAEWAALNLALAVAAGETAFRFLFMQRTLSLDEVAKRSGIVRTRLLDFDRGDAFPTAAESDALAPVLRCAPSDLTADR